MRMAFALVAATLAGNAGAAPIELLCKGEVVLGGEISSGSFVLELDSESGRASFWTPDGEGRGVLKAGSKDYLGHIVAPNGNRYSLTLDRYDGSLFLIRIDPPPPDRKVSFWGQCVRAIKQF